MIIKVIQTYKHCLRYLVYTLKQTNTAYVATTNFIFIFGSGKVGCYETVPIPTPVKKMHKVIADRYPVDTQKTIAL